MPNRSRQITGSVIAASCVAVGGLAVPLPAFGQAVADRALSDVEVQNIGACTMLTVRFNIRVQMLSYFPESGRELHVRLRPLDASVPIAPRESLRPPASVPSLRSIDYESDNPSGPVLSLYFTQDMRFEIEPGLDPDTLVIRIARPGTGPICAADAAVRPSVPSPGRPPLPDVEIPAGLYVINLLSRPKAIGDLTSRQTSTIAGKIVYETQFERESAEWHRLRLGFFESRNAAEEARAALLAQFPDAWVVKVTPDEREEGVVSRLDTGTLPAAAPDLPMVATSADAAETAQLIVEAEEAIRSEENNRAIQLLTKATGITENPNTPRALELLGLTRERNGQLAHARAEYQEYLRRYPEGEASDRVRQRLAALSAGAPSGGQKLREASRGSVTEWTWGARGSFSQFYYRDQSTTKFVDASRPEVDPDVQDRVNLNQLLTTGDITISGGNDRRQLELRAAGAYTFDFRNGGKDIKSLTALYLDYSDDALHSSVRVGRQTRNSAGVLGRFDGALIGFQANPKLRVNVVGGFPVLTSRQTHILKKRYFYGASVDIGARRSPIQTTLYWFDQRARGGFVDRQSVGLEARVLKKRFNAFTIIDYDVKFNKLNLGLITLNYNFPDNSNLSLTADYRQSPLLTTSNALIGQINSTTFAPILDLRGLRPFFTDKQIYDLAQDRTLTTKSVTVTYSRPVSEKLQVNVDFSLTDTGGTPGTPVSSGTSEIAPLPATGTEYYYGAQVVGTGLFWKNDIYILSARYADTQRSHTYTGDINARIPISSKFRLSPRLRVGYRKDKMVDSTFRQIQPTLRMNFYPKRHSEIEVEVGGDFSRRREVMGGGAVATTRESGFVVSAGYRIDF